MSSSDREDEGGAEDSAATPRGEATRRAGAGAIPVSRRSRRGPVRCILALALLLAGLLSAAPALAAPLEEPIVRHEINESRSRLFTEATRKPKSKCFFEEPEGAVYSAKTGELLVYDRAKNSIDRFSASGACIGRLKVGKEETGEEGNEGLAVDNDPTSESYGDVYVAAISGAEDTWGVTKYEYKPETGNYGVVKTIKKFKYEEEVVEELPEIHGLAVDASGNLWMYQGELVYGFNSERQNKYVSHVEVSGSCGPKTGFLVSPGAKYFYLGRERESRTGECEYEDTELVQVRAATGEPVREEESGSAYSSQLDPGQATTGAALDPSTGIVYVGHAGDIAAFAPGGAFLQRFGEQPGPYQLEDAAGVALDPATGEVFSPANPGYEGAIYVYTLTPEESGGTPQAELPDHRAYELVTPPNKHGSAVYPISHSLGVDQAAEDGEAITYTSSGPIVAHPAASRSPEPTVNLSRRGPAGWETQDLATPRGPVPIGYKNEGTEYRFFNAELDEAFVQPAIGYYVRSEVALSPNATETTPYRRSLAGGECLPVPSTCYQALVSPIDTTSEAFGDLMKFSGSSADGNHAVFASKAELPPAGNGADEQQLYEWSPSGALVAGGEEGGTLQLVSVLPTVEAGEEPAPDEAESADDPILGAANDGDDVEQKNGDTRHAISDDGNRVIWSSESGGQLYVRDMARGETLRVDVPEAGVPTPAAAAANFQTASADGSKIFFTDGEALTKDSTSLEGVEPLEQEDLYVCEVVLKVNKNGHERLACDLKDLTTQASNETAGVFAVVGSSDDGSYVYFVADGALAPGAGPGTCLHAGERATEGVEEAEGKVPLRSCNLYVVHDGSTGWEAPRFVARLTEADHPDFSTQPFEGLTSRVSSNGMFMAFMSSSSLTGYDNRDRASGLPDEEVYLYDYAANRVICASCNPKNERPAGVLDTQNSGEGKGLVIDRSNNWEGHWLAANIAGWSYVSPNSTYHLSNNLSDTGRLFFNSADPLVPAASNGKADVYEYEPDGEGTCASATGCISLISSGTSEHESAFVDASATGSDAFIYTTAQLVAADTDSADDIYDARVCTTESPCKTSPVVTAGPCAEKPEEATCRGGYEAPALGGVAPPSTQAGSGNHGTRVEIPKNGVLPEKTKTTPKKLTRKQLLEKALKNCKSKYKKNKKKRQSCEKQARKKYGAAKKAKKAKRAVKARRAGR